MSRHQIPTKSPRYEAFVGWDPQLQTYFAQVYDSKAEEDENPIVWLGAAERTSWHTIVAAVSPYAAVPLEIAEKLVEDRRLNRA